MRCPSTDERDSTVTTTVTCVLVEDVGISLLPANDPNHYQVPELLEKRRAGTGVVGWCLTLSLGSRRHPLLFSQGPVVGGLVEFGGSVRDGTKVWGRG